MIPLTNHDSSEGDSEVVIIYPDLYIYDREPYENGLMAIP